LSPSEINLFQGHMQSLASTETGNPEEPQEEGGSGYIQRYNPSEVSVIWSNEGISASSNLSIH
jgi:hypothetical protein